MWQAAGLLGIVGDDLDDEFGDCTNQFRNWGSFSQLILGIPFLTKQYKGRTFWLLNIAQLIYAFPSFQARFFSDAPGL